MDRGCLLFNQIIIKEADEKFVRFARTVFDKNTADEGLKALEDFIKECHLPTTLKELKSKVEITSDLLKQVVDTTNTIQSNSRSFTKDEIYEILVECL